jgi:predicted anti-sigma-YlaC factor YlaD
MTNYRNSPQQVTRGKGAQVDCIDIISMLGDYLDAELSHDLFHLCQAHFAECGYCRRLLDEYGTTVALASELRDVPPPEEVRTRLRERLREHLNIKSPR